MCSMLMLCRALSAAVSTRMVSFKLSRVLQDIVYVAPEAIVIAIYWLLNTVLLICAIICVWSYWQVRILVRSILVKWVK